MIEKPSIRERYKDVAHFDLIVENGTTHIDSVFIFKKPEELFPFIGACQAMNSTVVFENENLVIPPEKLDAMGECARNIELSMYCTIAEHPEIVQQYTTYLINEMAKEKAKENQN